jgi:hypothetical protein
LRLNKRRPKTIAAHVAIERELESRIRAVVFIISCESLHHNFDPPVYFFFIFLPHAVHFVFSKNCGAWHSLLVQVIISDAPQASHLSPTNVGLPQNGHVMVSARPHDGQRCQPRFISALQDGQAS